MPRRFSLLLAFLGFFGALLHFSLAHAQFGAIAWDRVSGKAGWTWNQATPQKAAEKALSECAASGCKVVIRTGARQCSAVATTNDGKAIGASARSTVDAARMKALEDCKKRKAGDCIVRASNCNK